MAAALLTPSRFGSSLSASTSQNAGYGALSMADTLPSADFGFNDLRERMAQFTVRFDEFIAKGRKRVLQERNAFRMNVAELEDTQRARHQQISRLESMSTAHASTLAKEATEAEEMHSAISSLQTQRSAAQEHNDNIRHTIAQTQAAIKQRKEAQQAHQRALDAQARHNMPELRFWEQCLGLRIEGTGVEDRLRFVFACMDERHSEREASFEMDMGGAELVVADTKPTLERDAVDELQEQMNANGSRELSSFLKGMRSNRDWRSPRQRLDIKKSLTTYLLCLKLNLAYVDASAIGSLEQWLPRNPSSRLAEKNPTQIGDPVSLKAETSSTQPTKDDKPNKQGGEKSLKDIAQDKLKTNPSAIGDPVSLKAETSDSEPTPDDRGALREKKSKL
nr:putative kinetochore protein spc25 [Quercus suber]